MIKTVINRIKRLALIAPLALAACGGTKIVAQPKPGLPALPKAKIERPAEPIKQILQMPSAFVKLKACVKAAYTCSDKKKELRPFFGAGGVWERLAYCTDYLDGCSGVSK